MNRTTVLGDWSRPSPPGLPLEGANHPEVFITSQELVRAVANRPHLWCKKHAQGLKEFDEGQHSLREATENGFGGLFLHAT
jgi:hypothetical protein